MFSLNTLKLQESMFYESSKILIGYKSEAKHQIIQLSEYLLQTLVEIGKLLRNHRFMIEFKTRMMTKSIMHFN